MKCTQQSSIQGGPLLAAVGLLIAIYVIVGALLEFADRTALFREPLSVSIPRVAGLPRSAFGTTFAHIGIGLVLLGIVAEAGWSEERIVALKAGDQVSIGQFELQFKGLIPRQGPNWRDLIGRFEVRKGGIVVATLEPAKRIYVADGQSTTEAGIETFGFGQLYASLGDPMADGAVSARIYWKPLVTLIWLGGVVMAIGGVFSISDRRLRIGAPRPARRRAIPAPAE